MYPPDVDSAMRAVRFHEHGGPNVLGVDDVEPPEPGPEEVLVEVEAVGVNPVDTYFREGTYAVPELPFVPGSDLAGVVAAVGDEVEQFERGDRVFGTGLGNGRSGTYAEAVFAPASFLGPLPTEVTFAQGAALALVGVTAWQAFVHHAGVEPAERVLIHGASGGVGHVAVQLADTMGAAVIGTAREKYHDRLGRLGADAVFEYDSDLETKVPAFGAPNVVLDTRANAYLDLDTEVAARDGRIVAIGNTADEATIAPINGPSGAKPKELSYQFMSMFNCPEYTDRLERLGRLCAAGDVSPVIARRYDLAEAGEAQRAVRKDSFLGKIVLET
jgi:NADPH:quinone reductase-like Zn-dependent oxidoreductase